MTTKPAFSMTDDTIMVVLGGVASTVRRGQPNFNALRAALINQVWDDVPRHLKVANSLQAWAGGRFSVEGAIVSYNGKALPESLNRRIVEMATRGESPLPFFSFWERLQRNPSHNSVNQLWDFLNHLGIPLTSEGCFLAYKGVKNDYTDKYTGTLDNSPGNVHRMPRNEISDDPSTPCHAGLHVGALEYAASFGERVVIVKVDPEHVVCVPKDESFKKMRVCEYMVIGNYGTPLSSTVHEDEEDHQCFDGDCEGEGDRQMAAQAELEGEVSTEEHPGPKVPKRFARLQAMDTAELLKLSIDRLRAYAYKGLKIVGATKIPGGKIALIERITATRRGA